MSSLLQEREFFTPMVSGSATATRLEDKRKYGNFARVCASAFPEWNFVKSSHLTFTNFYTSKTGKRMCQALSNVFIFHFSKFWEPQKKKTGNFSSIFFLQYFWSICNSTYNTTTFTQIKSDFTEMEMIVCLCLLFLEIISE